MVSPAKPNIAAYGNTAGDFGGLDLNKHKPPKNFDPSKLNRRLLTDSGEFTKFEEVIKDYILGRLGHPVVRVELTPQQIKSCIDEAADRDWETLLNQ